MPIHDWSRAPTGRFHHFHTSWIVHLADRLNGGVLPDGFSAYAQLRAAVYEPDVLTLAADPPPTAGPATGLAVAPRVDLRQVARQRLPVGRLLAVRANAGERLVAAVEIVSPRNKDRARSVGEFAGKVCSLLAAGVHVAVLDLFPPGRHDPGGLHPAVWEDAAGDDPPAAAPADRPYTFVGYQADTYPVAHLCFAALGQPIPSVPLFLDGGAFIELPLEESYMTSFARMPATLRAAVG